VKCPLVFHGFSTHGITSVSKEKKINRNLQITFFCFALFALFTVGFFLGKVGEKDELTAVVSAPTRPTEQIDREISTLETSNLPDNVKARLIADLKRQKASQ